MEFDIATTAVGFLVLFGIIAVGTLMSPMTTSTVMMVLGGLAVFGVLTLLLGVKHGEYRAAR
ncbi:DUF7333 family protein [halophilic archaeon]|uniref:DUF7333 family protein n=1 Tax=Halomicrococcus sp. SG-WS-1 TaxID=3439057 RepID=UPI000DDE6539|nr:hypothetical protein DMJ13_15700 [halophilic archaeon]